MIIEDSRHSEFSRSDDNFRNSSMYEWRQLVVHGVQRVVPKGLRVTVAIKAQELQGSLGGSVFVYIPMH